MGSEFHIDKSGWYFLHGYTHTPEYCKFSDETTPISQCLENVLKELRLPADFSEETAKLSQDVFDIRAGGLRFEVKNGALHAAVRYGSPLPSPSVLNPATVIKAREVISKGMNPCKDNPDELTGLAREYETLRSEVAELLAQAYSLKQSLEGKTCSPTQEDLDKHTQIKHLEKIVSAKSDRLLTILIHLKERHPDVKPVIDED